jgi:hypothetical protein
MAGRTMLDAMNVLAGIDGDAFGCHHGMEDREPSRSCAGWLSATAPAATNCRPRSWQRPIPQR